jgi:hypothetical protein
MSAGYANRTTPRTHIVSSGKAGSRLHQSVEMRGFDIGYPQMPDSLVALVVGKDEENVGLFRGMNKERESGGERDE